MNWKRKSILLCLLLILVAVLAAGCNFESTPYQINDSENYNVSVKFDANGGTFTVNAPIITDAYNVSGMPVNADGKVAIPLIAPDDARRDKDAFKPTRNGYFLAGWYAQCTESTDASGNVVHTYAQPWDFENDRLLVDPNETHSSAESVLTLYAAWAPLYEVEIYDLASGELQSSYSFDPTEGIEVKVPAWDAESGAVEMYKFPEWDGHTFACAYLDAEGTTPVETPTVTHPGTVVRETAQVENRTLKLYASFLEGEWYRISSAKQFADNFSLNANFDLQADLDFTDEIWPTAMMYGNFSGTIRGNGYTIGNVSITQTDNAKQNAGLFGQLTADAVLENVNFDTITFTVKKGARMAGTSYGLLAGTVADGAKLENVTVSNSVLAIDSGCYFGTDDYVIGLVCGMGSTEIDHSGIACEATGDAPENVIITVIDSAVTVEFVSE